MTACCPDPQTQTVSILVPFYDEKESLPVLVQEIEAALPKLRAPAEIIFVDDGSTDEGGKIIQDLAAQNPNLKLISLRKNFGQTAAWSAGMDYALGEILVFMDADLQNDPSDIPMLVEKITCENFDVVSGWRKQRRDNLLWRKIPSTLSGFGNFNSSWLQSIP